MGGQCDGANASSIPRFASISLRRASTTTPQHHHTITPAVVMVVVVVAKVIVYIIAERLPLFLLCVRSLLCRCVVAILRLIGARHPEGAK